MSSATLDLPSTSTRQQSIPDYRDLLSNHHQESMTDREELKDKLWNARVEPCGYRQKWMYFIPKNTRHELINPRVIEHEIRRDDIQRRCRDPGNCARWAYKHANQLFTILTYMGKGGAWIHRMYQSGISDEDLPLEAVKKNTIVKGLKRKSEEQILTAFDTWNREDLENFVRVQWYVLVPEFDKGNLKCRQFPEQTVLPLMSVENEGAPDEIVPREKLGGFSTVSAYRIHSAHHNFWSLNSKREVRTQFCFIFISN